MIEIPDPPTVSACATCMHPLLWLYSARTSRWVAFIPFGDPFEHTLAPHPCRSEPSGWPTWRTVPKGSPPNDVYRQARAALSTPPDTEETTA